MWKVRLFLQQWRDSLVHHCVYTGLLLHDGWDGLVCHAGLCLVPDIPSPGNPEGWSQKQNLLLPHCQLVRATGPNHCLSVCLRGRLCCFFLMLLYFTCLITFNYDNMNISWHENVINVNSILFDLIWNSNVCCNFHINCVFYKEYNIFPVINTFFVTSISTTASLSISDWWRFVEWYLLCGGV